ALLVLPFFLRALVSRLGRRLIALLRSASSLGFIRCDQSFFLVGQVRFLSHPLRYTERRLALKLDAIAQIPNDGGGLFANRGRFGRLVFVFRDAKRELAINPGLALR